MLFKCVEGASACAAQVHKATPSYDHFVNTKKLNTSLVRKQLLQWPSRELLNKRLVAVFDMLAASATYRNEWNLHPALEEDPMYMDEITICRSHFASGKKAVVVIVAASTLLEKSGEEQRAQADLLLTKKKDLLPDLIVRELEKLKS